MPDISMCKSSWCPKRETCYRFRAVPSQRQSYISPTEVGDSCTHYAPIQKGDVLRPEEK
jgi:hypothetical protein